MSRKRQIEGKKSREEFRQAPLLPRINFRGLRVLPISSRPRIF
jgi:hypothetical protein